MRTAVHEIEVTPIERRRYRPYPAYRDSGVAWLGRVPTNWTVDRLKWTIVACHNGTWGSEPDGIDDIVCVRVADFDRTAFRVSLSEPTFRAVTHSERNGRLLCKGDLLIEKSGGGELQPVGAVVNFDHDIPAVSSNFIARMPVRKGFDARFLAYFNAHLYTSRVNTRSIKQSTGIQNLDSMAYLSELATWPPLQEQQNIAAFLDRETARIDALIGKKTRLIELLQEKRAALISHAVTKGLNPNGPTKDSGVPWLGDMPAHWNLVPLKFVAKLQTGITLGKKYDRDEKLVSRPYLRVANVQDGYLDLTAITNIDLPSEDSSRYRLRCGDVLLTEGGDFDKLGRGYVWQDQIEECLHQNHIFAVRPNASRLDSHYLASLMASSHGKAYFTSTANQTTNLASTNSTKLKEFPAPLPPLSEQHTILDFAAKVAATHDPLIAASHDIVAKLREYRSALITAAVTGKIDVRDEVRAR